MALVADVDLTDVLSVLLLEALLVERVVTTSRPELLLGTSFAPCTLLYTGLPSCDFM